jgi:hypothetical protein
MKTVRQHAFRVRFVDGRIDVEVFVRLRPHEAEELIAAINYAISRVRIDDEKVRD